jgi:hypothetical protein
MARLSILILSKAYLSKIKDFTSNHARLLASEFVSQKVVNPYFHILAQILVEVIITR